MTKKQFYLFLLIATAITSCTVTKRHYRNGYHVEWHKNARVDNVPSTAETPATFPDKTPGAITSIKKPVMTEVRDQLATSEMVPAATKNTTTPAQHTIAERVRTAVKEKTSVSSRKVYDETRVPTTFAEDEQVLAAKHAKKALIWGLLTLLLFFLIGFLVCTFISAAYRNARMANELNTANDPKVAKQARLGKIFANIALVLSLILVVGIIVLIVLSIAGVI